jgi:hypothetical protein
MPQTISDDINMETLKRSQVCEGAGEIARWEPSCFLKKTMFAAALFLAFAFKAGAAPVRIVGEAQQELINSITHSADVNVTASLEIIVDGAKFRISSKSIGDHRSSMDEFGSDGTDVFLVSDRGSYFNRDGKGASGFAYPGRFPIDCAPIIQAVWLGYCSDGYFQDASNETGLDLSTLIIPMTPPTFITNLVTYWSNSSLPSGIEGWSRNLVIPHWKKPSNTDPPAVYGWYTNGITVWTFLAEDSVSVESSVFPRRLTLEGDIPKGTFVVIPRSKADTTPIRRVTFIAHSIEPYKEAFNPFPPTGVADFPIEDMRFTNVTGQFLLVSHVYSNNWPTRTSPQIASTMAAAHELAVGNEIEARKPGVMRNAAIGIIAVNLVIVLIFFGASLKKRKANIVNSTNISQTSV